MDDRSVSGVYPGSESFLEQAQSLANKLRLPVLVRPPTSGAYLCTGENGVALFPGNGIRPVRVEFCADGRGRSRRREQGTTQLIAKAAGLRGGATPTVLDATAGLGRDALVLASLGCRVQMIERSPVLAAMLSDGLRRAAKDPDVGGWIQERLTLLHGDAIAVLNKSDDDTVADVVYLDPMYPDRGKRALARRDLQALRNLLGEDDDVSQLLHAALKRAGNRVVVKRPRTAQALDGPDPTMIIKGTRIRFDVYVIASMPGE